MSLKYKLLFAFCVSVGIPVMFLHSPPPGPEVHASCMTTIVLKEGWTFPLNCDAGDFMASARDPARLFQKHAVRQNRPLLIFAAAMIGRGIERLNLAGLFPESYASKPTFKGLLNVYLAYVMLNGVILVVAILLFLEIIETYQPGGGWLIALPLSVLLAANGVVKFAFWSPHTVMFNVIMPLLTIYVVARIQGSPPPGTRWVLGVSLLGGVLTLAYGSFVLVLPCMVAACLLQNEYGKGVLWKMTGVFLAPTLLWNAVLVVTVGEIYNHEVTVWREFVWIADAWTLGLPQLGQALADNLRLFLSSFLAASGSYVLAVLALGTVIHFLNIRWTPLTLGQRNIVRACAVTAVFLAAFFSLMGYYAYHLSWNFVPILLVVSGGLLLNLHERLAGGPRLVLLAAVGLVVGASCAYMALKAGPYWSVQPSEETPIASLSDGG